MKGKNILDKWRQRLHEETQLELKSPFYKLKHIAAQGLADKVINMMGNGEYDTRIMDGRDTALIQFTCADYPSVRSTNVQEIVVKNIHTQHPYLEVRRFFYTKSDDTFHIHLHPRKPL